MSTYLQVESATKAYGDIVLFDDIGFVVNEGQKTALVAKNGSGKTTLMNIVAGRDSFDSGNYYINKGIKVGYLDQYPQFDPALTMFQAAYGASGELMKAVREYELALHSGEKKKLEDATSKMDHCQAWDIDSKIKQMLGILKLTNLDQSINTLSGGQLKRLALAVTLINEPDLLLLDEPTNHLDLDMIEWLEEYLLKTRSTLLMVTHDRYFLNRICNEIIEIDEKAFYSYKGNYSCFLEKREERLMAKNLATGKAQNLLRKELDWMRRMPKARSTKAKYRIDAFYTIKEQAEYCRNEKKIDINIKSARLGNKILVLDHVSKSFDKLVMLNDFSYTFSKFEKVGIIGPNGVGKTTFLNLITQQFIPDSGNIETGETIVYGYYEQQGLQFNPQHRVIDVVKDIAEVITLGDGKQLSVSQFLTHFLFPPEMHYVQVAKISGGEKRRLYLMTVLMHNPNFLILDEPTNDLDIVTLNVLEEYLSNFKGCLIIVSHDRFFMDKMVDHLFIFEGDGIVYDFPGNYSEYRVYQKQQELEETRKILAEKTKSNAPIKPKTPAVKTKLSYKEQRELEQLENELDNLEAEKALIEVEINSGKLKHDDLLVKSTRIGEIMKLIDEKTDRWLELNR